MKRCSLFRLGLLLLPCLFLFNSVMADTVKLGLNYPESGPYSGIGIDQFRAATLATEEINAAGGILGKQVEIIRFDTKSNKDLALKGATTLISQGAKMIFGGVSSGVAVAVSKLAQEKKFLFMATVTASNATTGTAAHRHTFRACYNAWMGAKALGGYLKKNYPNKRYFYITSDYTWGWSTEKSLRKFTNTEDVVRHKRVLAPLGSTDFKAPLTIAKSSNADVLVLVLFGRDMQNGIRQATVMGLKKKMQIVVPIIELSMAEGAGPKLMEGIVGTSDFNWKVPYHYGYKKGIAFVEKFLARYDRYPCWGAATAYTNLMEYKSAVERAGAFDTSKIIRALEGHKFTLLKNEQQWRDFDHQNIQDVYLVKCKPASKVVQDKLGMDFFEIIDRISGPEAVKNRTEWNAVRKANGLPIELEVL